MTGSEFAFLALGLILGVAAGAALMVVVRARPPSRHEVRLTVTPDSVPRRRTTLSGSEFAAQAEAPARGGPADRRAFEHPGESAPDAGSTVDRIQARAGNPVRTPVHASDQAIPSAGAATATALAARLTLPPHRDARDELLAGNRGLVGISIETEAPRSDASRADVPRAPEWQPESASIAQATTDDGRRIDDETGPPGQTGPQVEAGPQRDADASQAHARRAQTAEPGVLHGQIDDKADTCAAERRLAEERCAVAERLAGQADAARKTLRDEQRASDEHQMRATAAAERANPKAIRAAKEDAQQTFRTARAAAQTRESVETAARAWLQEINRINREAREATVAHRREQDAANALLPTLERLSLEADAARITAEGAQAACLAAREALASCEEAARATAAQPVAPSVAPGPPADLEEPLAGRAPVALLASDALAPGVLAPNELGAMPALFRMLRGDREAMHHAVEELSGGEALERRRWQLQLADLIDALLARAIESSTLDFPMDNAFWGLFTRTEARDVTAALGSLGYRFDGLGGFVDARLPSQRDLSLAVGYAGLDPMRIRRWPTEAEMAVLFRDVRVAADEYVAGAAASLTLGDLVTILGRRADGLTDLWNAWGRVRPLLLET